MMNRLFALVLAMVLCLFALPAFASAEAAPRLKAMMQTILPEADGDWDNEELFKAYLNREILGQEGAAAYGIAAGNQLSADQKAVYDMLKIGVADVAAGKREPASFLLERTYTYTAQDIGFTQLKVNGVISEAASNAALAKLGEDIGIKKILDALCSDCPYELYWFDKTIGLSYAANFAYTDTSITFNAIGLYFTVAKKFRVSENDLYTANTAVTKTAANTVAAAKAIVEKYKNKSDYEKLAAYKDEICNLVSYDHTAADGSSSGYFSNVDSDPWQVVYVFDGNASTNVVCEGYAKAFQYLCDLTKFDSPLISCYSVSGVMTGGTGSGGHMWNIVTMDDGKNYLVDVTNCDGVEGATGNAIGFPDKLFLKKPTSGSAQNGYIFKLSSNVVFAYYEATKEFWEVSDPDTILKLADTDYVNVHTCSFSWKDGNAKTAATHTLTCSCGESKEENHTQTSAANCQTAAVCSVCGSYGEKNADNHASAEFTYVVNGDSAAKHDKKYACCGAVAATENHNWAYEEQGSTLTKKCQNCQADGGTLTVSAPADLIYDGTTKEAKVSIMMDGVAFSVEYEGSLTDGKPVDAGTYTASVTLGGKTASVQYAIAKRPVTVTAQEQTVSVGMEIAQTAYAAEGLASGHTLTAALSADTAQATDNGTISIGSVVIKDGETDVTANYDVTRVSGKLVVTTHVHNWSYSAGANPNEIKAVCSGSGDCSADENTAIVTLTGGTYEYDGTKKQAVLTQDPAGTFNDINVNYSADPVNAGSYTATIKLGGKTATAQIVISPKAVTVTAEEKSKTYGDADPELTYQAVGLVDGEKLAGELTRAEGDNVGEYAINQGTLTNDNNPNYAITYTGAKLTITKKQAAAAPTVTGSCVLSGNTYTYTVTSVEGAEYRMDDGSWQDSNVFSGIAPNTTHTFSARIKGSDNQYTGAEGKSEAVTFDRLQGSGTVSISGWTYGQAANSPAVESATNGTDNVTYLYESTDGKGYSAAAAPVNAGSYKVTAMFAATEIYGACSAAAEFTIERKAVTVTAAEKSKTYGDADPELTYQAVGLVDGETLAGELTRAEGDNVGEYAINQGTLTNDNNPNYAITYTGAKLTITKKPAAAAPNVTGSYVLSGNTYTYTVNPIDGAEYRMDDGTWQDSNVFSGIAPNTTHTFFARIKGSDNQDTGAEGKSEAITFDRLQGSGTVSISGWTYGQAANSPVAVSETNGTDNVTYLYESTDGKGYSAAAAPTNAGSYKVTAMFAATETYGACSATAEFTIAKAVPAVTAVTGLNATYGDLLSSVVLPEGWTWVNSAVGVGNAGENSFEAVYALADTQNYEPVNMALTVTVKPKAITADFSAVAASYPYTGSEIKPAVTVADGANTVDQSEYTVVYSDNVNVGTAKITVSSVAGGNYTVSGTKEFSIVKAAAPAVQPYEVTILREIDTTGNEVDLAKLLPQNRGETTYSITSPSDNAAVKNFTVNAAGKVTFDTAKSDAASEAVYVIKAVMQNYSDVQITVKIILTDKEQVTITGVAAASGLTYDGTAKIGYTGTPSAAPYTGAFSVVYAGTQADGTAYGPVQQAPVNAGSYTVTISVPDSAVYTGSTTVSFAIAKAKVTIKANDRTELVGQAMPDLGYEVIGLVGGDQLTAAPTIICPADMNRADEYTITVSGADAGANYEISYQDGKLSVVMGGTESAIAQIVAKELTSVASGLLSTPFNTVEKIKAEQTRTLIEGNTDYTEKNVAHYDVKLQFSLDGGKTWIDASEVNFPFGGVTVRIDYPEGTSKDTHDFIVSHMFTMTSERLGTVAGKTEQPDVVELEDALEFTVNGLSPVSIAWKETPEVQDTANSLPKTGDASTIAIWTLLCFAALIGSSLASSRREY